MVDNFQYPDFIFLNLGKDKVKSLVETLLLKLIFEEVPIVYTFFILTLLIPSTAV